ncbi:hypothetical protein BH24ACT3_BH24ACT3_08610 [soil metagenome]
MRLTTIAGMELTPRLLTEEVEFRETFRGYDRNEVDDFLERVAVAVGQLQTQLADAVTRAKTAESRASSPTPPPARTAAPPADDPTEELRRTLVLAQRTADAAIKEAHDEADRVVDDARSRAERMLRDAQSEAERESAERRRELQREVERFESDRGLLQGDVSALERHLDKQRQQLSGVVERLQRLLDEPDGLRATAPPELSDPPGPALSPPLELDAIPGPSLVVPPGDPVASPVVVPDDVDLLDPEGEADDSDRPAGSTGVDVDEPTGAYAVVDELDVEASPPPAEYAALAEDAPGTPPSGAGDDAFLAELRKAMTDEEPLGPRDEDQPAIFDQDDEELRHRPRFGRRR